MSSMAVCMAACWVPTFRSTVETPCRRIIVDPAGPMAPLTFCDACAAMPFLPASVKYLSDGLSPANSWWGACNKRSPTLGNAPELCKGRAARPGSLFWLGWRGSLSIAPQCNRRWQAGFNDPRLEASRYWFRCELHTCSTTRG
jgi:hypothetical protein